MQPEQGPPASGPDPETEDNFLPPFANEENKRLNEQVRHMEKQLEQTGLALDENKDRINIMSDHLKNVQSEIQYTQARVETKRKEVDTERHLKALSQREVGRMEVDINRLQKEQEDLYRRATTAQSEIQRGTERMDQFKLQMNWNQEELEQWAMASRQKEEDNAVLEKYTKQDDGKVRDLGLAIEKVTRQVAEASGALEAEVTETQGVQIQLDKTAEDFRQLHADRQELVRQWEAALDTVRQRDQAIQDASEQFASRKARLREVQTELAQQEKFLEQEVANNREMDAQIALADREVAGLREAHAAEVGKEGELEDELTVLRNTILRVRGDLQQRRAENGTLRAALGDKEDKLRRLVEKYEQRSAELNDKVALLSSLDSRAAQLDALQSQEEQRLSDVQREVQVLKDHIFRRSEALGELRRKERDLIAEITGGQGQSRNLQSKIRGLDGQVMKQEELLYNADFQVQMMERKVGRAQGERTDEEKRVLNERIGKLTTELEAVNAEHMMLTGQVKRAEDDLQRARRRHASLERESDGLDSTLGAMLLEISETGRAVKAAVRDKEERMVAHDVMRLEVKKLQDALSLRADEVYSLENRRQQLQLSLEERRQEVQVHQETRRGELKMVSEDVHRLTLELKERELKVQRLEAKYAVVVAKSRATGEDGEEHTQAYYVIKAAQEREELQREGDQLDAKIRKAEKEVRALEATLARLNDTNNGYRGSFRHVDHDSAAAEKQALRERLDKAYDKLKVKRATERGVRREVEQGEEGLASLQAEEQRLNALIGAMGREKADADATVHDQGEKIGRAERRLQRLRADLRSKAGIQVSEGDTPLEMDIALTDMREVNRAILLELKGLAMQYPRAGIQEQVDITGLRLPGSSRASRPDSAASGRSASRGAVPPRAQRVGPVASLRQ